MRKDTFIPQHTVPDETKSENVIAFTFYPGKKNVTVHTDTDNAAANHNVDITPLWSIMTTNQKNIVKGFFKEIAALRLSTTQVDVIGDMLD